MVCVLVYFVVKKPHLTHTQFKTIMETEMVPLFNSVTGPLKPIKWTRRYIAHAEGESQKKDGPLGLPALLVGHKEDIGWDCFCEMFFKDELHLQQYFAFVNEEEPARKLLEAEGKCSQIEKMRMVIMESFSEGEVHTSSFKKREGVAEGEEAEV